MHTVWQQCYTSFGDQSRHLLQIFTGLTGSDVTDHVISTDVTEQDINRALEKWLYYWKPQYSSLQERSRAAGNDDEDEEEDDIDHKSPERHFDSREGGGFEYERSKEDEL